METPVQRKDAGQTVYGVKQFLYTDGEGETVDFGSIIAKSTLKQTAVAEEQAKASAKVLKLRQAKSQDLGNALALCNKVMSTFRVKGAESSDKLVVSPSELQEIYQTSEAVKKYDLNLDVGSVREHKTDDCKKKPDGNYEVGISRGDMMRIQARVEEMIDTENNDIQQDMMSVQGLMKKRDDCFANAGELSKKFNKTADNVVQVVNNQ